MSHDYYDVTSNYETRALQYKDLLPDTCNNILVSYSLPLNRTGSDYSHYNLALK